MVALIYKISGDAAEKENRRAALILCLHSTAVSVTPRLKISNIQLHVIQNVNSQSHRSCRTYCNTLNRCVSCQLCVPYFLTLSSNKTVWYFGAHLEFDRHLCHEYETFYLFLKFIWNCNHLDSVIYCLVLSASDMKLNLKVNLKLNSLIWLCYWTIIQTG